MADEKVNMGPEENKPPETLSPPGQGDLPPLEENNAPAVSGEDKTAPDHVEPDPPSADKHTQQTVLPGMGEDTPAPSGKVINLSDIQAADKDGKEASTTAPEKKAPEAEQPKKRRGRPPKEQAALSAGKKEKAAEPRTGRPSKVDKAAREEAPPAVRDKVSRGKKADKGKERGSGGAPASKPAQVVKPGKAAPIKEAAVPPPEINLPPTPDVPPRPVEEGKIVYLKMAELHPFHTFREHPYKVQDDKAMDDLVGTIKEHGIMTPATVRPEKDGKGYEIIAGHRRCHGGERAGLDEIPCIVREMTDLEAVREMKNSNKQRGDPLPSELAKLLDLELEAIKRQGARPKNDQEAEALGKLSVEIVGKEHDMNYKKVLRYVRLNHLVPELLEKVDTKNMGFMPAVELSYIKPENQRLIAVSIDGEQSSPSVKQAKRLRELDQEGLLNGDVIDGILSEEKREVDNVIISTDELNKYFGKEITPAKMKEQIMALLDEWKAGEATEDSFAALANENSEDPGSSSNGGLYEDVYPGQMVDPFDEWCFDDARQPGDTGIVKTDYGYHVMYYVSKGEEVFWFEAAKSDLQTERENALEESIREQYPLTETLENAAIFDVQAEDRAAANAAAAEAAASEAATEESGTDASEDTVAQEEAGE